MKNLKIDATAASSATFASGPSFEVDASGNVVGKGGVFACVLSSGTTCP